MGISPDAARKRLERGTLRGEIRAGRWLVSPDPDAAADMTPLADLIATLSRENRELAATAAMWQERARFLGEQPQTFEVGPVTGDVQAAGLIRESGHQPSIVAAEASEASRPVWRRLWRRVTGVAVSGPNAAAV